MKSVTAKTPTLARVNKPSERVRHDIQVWGDMKAINVRIVSNVPNYRDIFLWNYSNKALKKSSCPNPSGQSNDQEKDRFGSAECSISGL